MLLHQFGIILMSRSLKFGSSIIIGMISRCKKGSERRWKVGSRKREGGK